MSKNLLASSPSFEGIQSCITKFYCGEEKTLELEREGVWTVHRKENGMNLLGVRVYKRGKRFRFETVL